MEDSKQLISENTQLKQELEILKGKLQHVQKWMEREIQQQVHVIAKQKTKNLTSKVKNEFLKENFEEVIAKQINDYFGELLLLNSPK